MTRAELKAALRRMGAAERAFLRELTESGAAPREIMTYLEFFVYFPGTKLVEPTPEEIATRNGSTQLSPQDPLPF